MTAPLTERRSRLEPDEAYKEKRDQALGNSLESFQLARFAWFFTDEKRPLYATEVPRTDGFDFEPLREVEQLSLDLVNSNKIDSMDWVRDSIPYKEYPDKVVEILSRDITELHEFQKQYIKEIIQSDPFLQEVDRFFIQLENLSNASIAQERELNPFEAEHLARNQMDKSAPGWQTPDHTTAERYERYTENQRRFQLLTYQNELKTKRARQETRKSQQDNVEVIHQAALDLLGKGIHKMVVEMAEELKPSRRTYTPRNSSSRYSDYEDTPLTTEQLRQLKTKVLDHQNAYRSSSDIKVNEYQFFNPEGERIYIAIKDWDTSHDSWQINRHMFEWRLGNEWNDQTKKLHFDSQESIREILRTALTERAQRKLKKVIFYSHLPKGDTFYQAIQLLQPAKWHSQLTSPHATDRELPLIEVTPSEVRKRPDMLIFWKVMQMGIPYYIQRRQEAIAQGVPNLGEFYHKKIEPAKRQEEEEKKRFRSGLTSNATPTPNEENPSQDKSQGLWKKTISLLTGRKEIGNQNIKDSTEASEQITVPKLDVISFNTVGNRIINSSREQLEQDKQKIRLAMYGNTRSLREMDTLLLADNIDGHEYSPYVIPLEPAQHLSKEVIRMSNYPLLNFDEKGSSILPLPPNCQVTNFGIVLAGSENYLSRDSYQLFYSPELGKYKVTLTHPEKMPNRNFQFRADVLPAQETSELPDIIFDEQRVENLVSLLEHKKLILLAETIRAFYGRKKFLSVYTLTAICKAVSTYSYDEKSNTDEQDIFERLSQFIDPRSRKLMIQCNGAGRLLAGCLGVLLPVDSNSKIQVGLEECFQIEDEKIHQNTKNGNPEFSSVKYATAADAHVQVLLKHEKGIYRQDSTPVEALTFANLITAMVQALKDLNKKNIVLDPERDLAEIGIKDESEEMGAEGETAVNNTQTELPSEYTPSQPKMQIFRPEGESERRNPEEIRQQLSSYKNRLLRLQQNTSNIRLDDPDAVYLRKINALLKADQPLSTQEERSNVIQEFNTINSRILTENPLLLKSLPERLRPSKNQDFLQLVSETIGFINSVV